MGYLKMAVAVLLMLVLLPAAALAAPIPLRGVVEGFYGTPWTMENRIDLLRFCGEHGLNAYIYAPKDDPYHRAKWRELYPKKKLKDLASLVKTAKKNHVKFIFAISPGLDFHYTMLQGGRDRELLLKKLEALYGIGVRDFAVFFDDIEELNGKGQAELLNWLDEKLVKAHGDVSPLITVPTEYYYRNMVDEKGKTKAYTGEFSRSLKDDILVLYTGDKVVCPGITEEQLEQADRRYGRELGIWWNYPVTDYLEAKLALGPVEKLPRQGNVPAIFFNPMKYEQMSKIALATGADYAKDPEGYDPQVSWERAIEKQYGKLSSAMKAFADQSQHLENNWAEAGRPDGAELRSAMDDLWASWPRGEHAERNWGRVRDQVMELYRSSGMLLQQLPEEQLRECRPQLQQLKLLAEADGYALDLLRNMKPGQEKVAADLYDALKKKRREIQHNEKKALVSEKTARAFVDEVLDYADKNRGNVGK